jgi:hypothetical protein
MKNFSKVLRSERGAWGWGALWLIGVPIPVLLILFLMRGCT